MWCLCCLVLKHITHRLWKKKSQICPSPQSPYGCYGHSWEGIIKTFGLPDPLAPTSPKSLYPAVDLPSRSSWTATADLHQKALWPRSDRFQRHLLSGLPQLPYERGRSELLLHWAPPGAVSVTSPLCCNWPVAVACVFSAGQLYCNLTQVHLDETHKKTALPSCLMGNTSAAHYVIHTLLMWEL